jgi:prepilin-type N-terminal cleavage/methylation domain-containing protein
MIKREAGFSLVELMITMVVFLLVIAAAASVFTGLLTQFKQQSKISETNIEGIVGLEILRQDIENAGYGLPWNGLVAYNEASAAPASNYNDNGNPPRGILSGNNTGFNGSDYLVIKAINVAMNDQCKKWTTLKTAPFGSTPAPGNPRIWVPDRENVNKKDDGSTNNNVRVIVLSPGNADSNRRTLVTNGTAFFTNFNSITSSPWPPTDTSETPRIVYGVDPDTDLRMPFNRADYFLSIANVPQRCAPNTGILEKVVVNQSDGGLTNFLPLLDCVADMQVIYRRDTDGDGIIDNTTDDISALTVQQIRDQVQEVRVYILAHEGQYDRNFTYPNSTITVGEFGLGSNFNLATTIGTNWQNYRWKVYTLVVKPDNLR